MRFLGLGLAVLLLVAAQASPQTTRLFLVGNSLTDSINYGDFERMAEQRGGNLIWGRHMIPGAPLSWNWEHGQPHEHDGEPRDPEGFHDNQQATGDRRDFADALTSYRWDALSLQPFDRHVHSDFKHVAAFVNLLKRHEANLDADGKVDTQIYLYAHWPARTGIEGTDPTEFEPLDFADKWLMPYTGGWDKSNRTRDFFEQLLAVVNDPDSLGTTDPGPSNNRPLELFEGDEHPARLLNKPVRLIPIGDTILAIEAAFQARDDLAETIGIDGVDDFYSDGAHFNERGRFLVGTVVFATLYETSPVGLDPAPYQPDGESFDPEFVSFIQETAWDVVSRHPHAGVKKD
jgi:hypothetical protein